MKRRKTWVEKMQQPGLPKVVAIPPRMEKTCGPGMMLVPCAEDVRACIDAIPEGAVKTQSQIRETLAQKYLADVACPMVTGICVWIVANAAEEAGWKTPYWRVVKDGGRLNPKFPGGVEAQAERLRSEGLAVRNGRLQFEEAPVYTR